jgi:hypothetical protein
VGRKPASCWGQCWTPKGVKVRSRNTRRQHLAPRNHTDFPRHVGHRPDSVTPPQSSARSCPVTFKMRQCALVQALLVPNTRRLQGNASTCSSLKSSVLHGQRFKGHVTLLSHHSGAPVFQRRTPDSSPGNPVRRTFDDGGRGLFFSSRFVADPLPLFVAENEGRQSRTCYELRSGLGNGERDRNARYFALVEHN